MAPDLIERLAESTVVDLSDVELDVLLGGGEVVRQAETGLAGAIRVLVWEGRVLVQEQTPGGERLVRELASRDDADRFVDERLAAYDRMWDG